MKNKNKIYPVILAGGKGSRLWPLSTPAEPKQFLPLLNHTTLIQHTMNRLNSSHTMEKPIVLINKISEENLINSSLHYSRGYQLMIEPTFLGTLAAITLAALNAYQKDQESLLLVMPSDHYIADNKALFSSVSDAAQAAVEQHIVTFGVQIKYPETGYGYIQKSKDQLSSDVYLVSDFVEKPLIDQSLLLMEEGNYFWNTAIYMMSTAYYLNLLQEQHPDLLKNCTKSLLNANIQDHIIQPCKSSYHYSSPISFENGLLSAAKNRAMVMLKTDWLDLGSWPSLWSSVTCDHNNNYIVGKVITENVTNSYIYAKDCQIAIGDIDDQIVVATPKSIFMAKKDKLVVSRLMQKISQDLMNVNQRC